MAQLERERLLLACDALLSDDEARFTAPLAELESQLLRLLAPQSLNPQDSQNAVQELERSYQDGLAELERAGHRGREMSVYEFVHRLAALERRAKT